MANLIQATVYQIDGAPQQPSPIALDFRTREVVIKEATIPTIAAVQSAILYYNVPNNPQSVQTFYVSEDIATLVGAANNAGTSQTQVTVLTINKDPQIPGGVQYSFPSAEILVGEFTDASIGVQAYIQYKNVKYYTQENEAAILAASNNTGVAAGTNPTSLFIPYNNAGIFGDSFLENDAANDILKTVYSASDIGLKLDFFNQVYEFGGVFDLFGIRVNSNNGIDIGDYIGFSNGQQIRIVNDVIKTEYLGNDIGLKLDFANQSYKFGSTNNDYGLIVDALNGTIQLGDIAGWYGGGIYFNIDNLNNFLSVQTGGVDVGLKLDFANLEYYLGGVTDQYNVKVSQGTGVDIGDIFGAANGNQINLTNDIIKTQYSSNDIGLYLDFLNQSYDLGNPASTLFRVNDSNGRLQSKYNGDDIGISFDIQNGEYYIGDFDSIINGTAFAVDDTSQKIVGLFGSTVNGLELDFANSTYKLGDISSNFIGVDSANNKLIASANLLSNTAGGTSGQHIKINIGGTDYKIALLNP